jgi:hypothetical protein
MTWYAAHIVMVVKYKGKTQRRFPAWENIVLVRAASEQSAIAKAEAIGRDAEGDDEGTFRWGGKAAAWEFSGVRKVTECCVPGATPVSGDEITYSELEFASLADAKRYGRGAPMSVRHDDQIRSLDEADLAETARPKRKPA